MRFDRCPWRLLDNRSLNFILVAVIVGCERGAPAPSTPALEPYVDPLLQRPDVSAAVEEFWIDFSQPDDPAAETVLLGKAYTHLHPRLQEEQTLQQFSEFWTKWMDSQTAATISGFIVAEVKDLGDDRAEVIVSLAIGGPPGMPGANSRPDSPQIRMLILRYEGSWTVRELQVLDSE